MAYHNVEMAGPWEPKSATITRPKPEFQSGSILGAVRQSGSILGARRSRLDIRPADMADLLAGSITI